MTKIALAQMCIDYENSEKNISTAQDMLLKAIDNQCASIVFPELWSTGFKLENREKYSYINASLLPELQKFSNNNDIEIFGSFLVNKEQDYFNEFIALIPNANPALYNKVNLFPTLQETKYLQAGNKIHVFDSKLGVCAPSICFDLRFPWMYKEMVKKGAQIHIIPAHWPAARTHHWDILLQARAIETLSYVIAVNSVGKSNNVIFGGHSSVISPDGDMIFQANDSDEDVFVVEIDTSLVQRVRNKHPFYSSII